MDTSDRKDAEMRLLFVFFQAEDGIRDIGVTGVQTCALPIFVLYAFHNWELPVVACAVGAVYAVHGWRTSRPLADRAVVAAVLLGLGFAVKLYPGAFVLPLTLLVLTAPGRGAPLDWRGAARGPGRSEEDTSELPSRQ